MLAIDKPLASLQATDLMSRDLCIIPEDMPLREAARTLVRHGISGAPVVDYRRSLVGVISSSDFMRHLCRDGRKDATSPCVYSEWQVVDVCELPDGAVQHFMSQHPVTADKSAPIAELARRMVEAHVHRIIIVNANNSPCGIVTTMDLLAALGQEEAEVELVG